MSASHTPAPWSVKIHAFVGDDGEPIVGTWIEAGEYRSIANLMPNAEVQANARLCASAPDLLSALKQLLDLGQAGFIHGDDIAVARVVNAAKQAVAKAEGRRP